MERDAWVNSGPQVFVEIAMIVHRVIAFLDDPW
jgi:hypothetical protein